MPWRLTCGRWAALWPSALSTLLLWCPFPDCHLHLPRLYTGYPIFPGENEQLQLACIMEVMGLPDKYLIDRSSRKKLFFGERHRPFQF
jgi:hypothetical protein